MSFITLLNWKFYFYFVCHPEVKVVVVMYHDLPRFTYPEVKPTTPPPKNYLILFVNRIEQTLPFGPTCHSHIISLKV